MALVDKSGTSSSKVVGLPRWVRTDLPASLVVFLVALPLSLGIAMASGAPPMAGLIGAIVGGILVGCLGGAPLQVSGPAAGLTVLVLGFVQQFGWQATCVITLMAGIVQMVLGWSRVAPMALGIAPAVIHGMLASIGILIAASQASVLLGHGAAGKGLKAILALPDKVSHLNPTTTLLGLLTIAVLVVWPRLPWARVKKFPGALAAILIATGAAAAFGLTVPRVALDGTLFNAIRLPVLPEIGLAALLVPAITMTIVASAESLLCAVATDKLHTGPRANLDRELLAQGAGNTLSGLLGGLPITGVIVRSTANIASGGETRLSAILHGVWILLFVVLAPQVLTAIPLAALAGLLVHTGISLVKRQHILDLRLHGELPIYLITVGAILATDLLTGLGIGFAASVARLLWKFSHVEVHQETHGDEIHVALDGSLTFVGVPRALSALGKLAPGKRVQLDLCLRFVDHTGFEALESWKRTYELTGGSVTMDGLEDLWERSRKREAMLSRRDPERSRKREAMLSQRDPSTEQ